MMLGVENPSEVFEEVLAMVEEVPKLCICEPESATNLGLLETKRADGVDVTRGGNNVPRLGNSFLNCVAVSSELGRWKYKSQD